MSRRQTAENSDVARYVLLGATLFLALGGLVMIYSASSAADFVKFGDSTYHLKRQVLQLVLGFAVLWFVSRLPLDTIRRLGVGLLVASDVALVYVLLQGRVSHGARSWIDLGFTTFQPSELAKVACVIVVAGLMADRQRHPRPITEDAGALAAIVLPPVFLLMAQPDMGTTMSLVIPLFLLMVLGGLEWQLTVLGSIAGLGAGLFMMFAQSYRADRFTTFLDPWSDPQGKGYQIIQALLAFGSGGIAGQGLGLSRQKYFYLPEAQNDFIFAIIGEELGLWGSLLVVAAFATVGWAGFRIAVGCKDPFGRLLAGGLTTMVLIQALMNMAAVTGVMPVTGIPLPLVSSGGTSILFTMGCIGLILCVARHGQGRVRRSDTPAGDPGEKRDLASTGERRRHGRPRLSVIDGGRAASRRRA